MKLLIFSFILFISPITIYSQIINDYGVKMGVMVSGMSVERNSQHVFNYNNFFEEKRTGIAAGFYLNMFKTEYFDIQNELMFIQEGAVDKILVTTEESPDGIDELEWDHEYDFLRYSLNLRPMYENQSSNIDLILGTTINYLVSNRGMFYLYEQLKDFYFGYNLGGGFILKDLLNFPLGFEVKYNGYFTRLANNAEIKTDMNSWQLNITLGLN